MTAGSSGRGGAGEGVLEDEDELETEEELEVEAEVEHDEEGDELEGDHKLEGVDALEEGGEDAFEAERGAMLEGEGEDAGGPE